MKINMERVFYEIFQGTTHVKKNKIQNMDSRIGLQMSLNYNSFATKTHDRCLQSKTS